MTQTPYTPHAQPQYPMPPQKPTGSNGLATAGFVLGLLALLGSWVPVVNVVSILLAVVGLILAAVGLAKSKEARTGKGLAISGLILSLVSIVIAVVVNGAVFSVFSDFVEETVTVTVTDADGNEVADGVGDSVTNPAPLGSSVTGRDWKVSVDAVSPVDADATGATAQDGKVLIAVTLTATYVGDDAEGEGVEIDLAYEGPGDTYVHTTDSTFVAENPFDDDAVLLPAESTSGNLVLEVPADWEEGALSLTPALFSLSVSVAVK